MTRLYGDYAYSDGPVAGCYWAEAVPPDALHHPALTGRHRVGALVIGGGYTGLNAALHLAEAGHAVTLIDAAYPGFGASGRNGGFCCLGGSRAPDAVLRRFGDPRDVRRAEVAAVTHVGAMLDRLGIDADGQAHGEAIVAHSPAMARHLPALADDFAEAYGVTPKVIAAQDMADHGMGGRWHGAVSVPIGFSLHPRKYLAGLLRAAIAAGVQVHGQTAAEGIEATPHGVRVATDRAEVLADHVVLATNGYGSETVPAWIRARTLPAQSSVIATRQMSAEELAAQGWTTRQMAYEERRLLHYFHLTPDNRMVFGQRGGLISTPANEARIAQRVRRDFDRVFPAWAGVETPHSWSGMVCLTASLTPYCGPVPGVPGLFTAFGYHGNGVAMGSYLGAAVADMVRGVEPRASLPAAFRKPPPRFPLGRWRRAWLAAEYGWAMLTDRARYAAI